MPPLVAPASHLLHSAKRDMPAPAPSLRERNKAKTRNRIRQAAAEVFLELGFDRATVNDVAERAEVALRTVFLYARDKRDLLFLVFNEDLDALFAAAHLRAPAGQNLVDRLVEIFAPLYGFFRARLPLARSALREMVFFDADKDASGPAHDFHMRRKRVHAWLVELLSEAVSDGSIAPRDDIALAASSLQATFLVEIRMWLLSPAPDVKLGIVRLRRLFALQVEGLHPR